MERLRAHTWRVTMWFVLAAVFFASPARASGSAGQAALDLAQIITETAALWTRDNASTIIGTAVITATAAGIRSLIRTTVAAQARLAYRALGDPQDPATVINYIRAPNTTAAGLAPSVTSGWVQGAHDVMNTQRDQLNTAASQIEALDIERNRLHQELSTAQGQLLGRQTRIQELEAEVTRLEEEVKNLNQRLTNAQTSSGEDSADVVALRSERDLARQERDTARTALEEAQAQANAADAYINAAGTRILAAATARSPSLRRDQLARAQQLLRLARDPPRHPTTRTLETPPDMEPTEPDMDQYQDYDLPTNPSFGTLGPQGPSARTFRTTPGATDPLTDQFPTAMPDITGDKFWEITKPRTFDGKTGYQKWKTVVTGYVGTQGHRVRLPAEILLEMTAWTTGLANTWFIRLLKTSMEATTAEGREFLALRQPTAILAWIFARADKVFTDFNERDRLADKLSAAKQTGTWISFFQYLDSLRMDFNLDTSYVLLTLLTKSDQRVIERAMLYAGKHSRLDMNWDDCYQHCPRAEAALVRNKEIPDPAKKNSGPARSPAPARSSGFSFGSRQQPAEAAAPVAASSPVAVPLAKPCLKPRFDQEPSVPASLRGKLAEVPGLRERLRQENRCFSCRRPASDHRNGQFPRPTGVNPFTQHGPGSAPRPGQRSEVIFTPASSDTSETPVVPARGIIGMSKFSASC